MTGRNKVNIALIDMNNGHPNQGMRGIKDIIGKYSNLTGIQLDYDIFSLRDKGEIPGLNYDIYISSGGPGSPLDDIGSNWEMAFFNLLDQIEQHNRLSDEKKHAFLICHSFQLACRKYGLARVTKRKSTAFGIFPVHFTPEGQHDPVFEGLSDTFYSVDSRDYQVVEPDIKKFKAMGANILALEKERPHVDLERCIMAIRFTHEIIGTQFHPEADPEGMKMYLQLEEKKKLITENHGADKYFDMLNSLEDPARISLTQSVILPNFLSEALGAFSAA